MLVALFLLVPQVERVYFEIDEDKLDQWEKPQIKESKKAFFYATISDGGDKEKMECFVDFCEDAIFEMQHSASLVEEDSEEGKVGKKCSLKSFFLISLQIVRKSGPTMPKEDEPKGLIAPLKEQAALAAEAVSPANLAKSMARMRMMSQPELVLHLLSLVFWVVCVLGGIVLSVLGFFLSLMRGSFGQEEKAATKAELMLASKKKSKSKQSSLNKHSIPQSRSPPRVSLAPRVRRRVETDLKTEVEERALLDQVRK